MHNFIFYVIDLRQSHSSDHKHNRITQEGKNG